MSASAFTKGSSFELDGKCYLLTRLVENDIWQAEEIRTKRIVEFSLAKLQNHYVERTLIFTADNVTSSCGQKEQKDVIDYTSEQWADAKLRRMYVIDVLDIPSSRVRLTTAIHATWVRLNNPEVAPNPSTVMDWKAKYIRSGNDIRSLISQSHKRGNRSLRYPKEVEHFVGKAIEKKYMCQERGTFQDVLAHALVTVLRENKLRPDTEQLPLPTMRLVRRQIEAIPVFDRHAARFGRTAAVKTFRSVLGHRTTSAPLERAEMDHTQLDLMVLDDNSGLPLGRPWLTVCIDDFTRCILGIYVGFMPPSHASVASCLMHAFLPKVQLAGKYPAIQHGWAAHGVMQTLVVDNGVEFHCISLENACYTLGIEIHYSARKTPWFKGKVERFNGTFNRAVAHGTPGTTFGNIFEKDEYDPVKHAIVRFSVLLEVVNTWVVDVYHQQVHRALGAPPAVVWERSISPEDITVPDDPALLDAILGQSEKRQLTHKGIELYGLLYNSRELTSLRRKHGSELKVEIRVDLSDLGKIVVLSPDKREMFVAMALNHEYASGLSAWQHKVCKRFAANQLNSYDQSSWLEAKARIATLIDDEVLNKKVSTRVRIARYKGDKKLLSRNDAESTKTVEPVVSDAFEAQISGKNTVTVPMPAPAESSILTGQTDHLSEIRLPDSSPTAPAKRKFKPVHRLRTLELNDDENDNDD